MLIITSLEPFVVIAEYLPQWRIGGLPSLDKFKLKTLPEFTTLPEDDNQEYPLILISAKSRYYPLSSYRWLERLRQKRPQPDL